MTPRHNNVACRGHGSRELPDTSTSLALNVMLRMEDAGYRTEVDGIGASIRLRHFTPDCPECRSLESTAKPLSGNGH
jgi:hypothetical protein